MASSRSGAFMAEGGWQSQPTGVPHARSIRGSGAPNCHYSEPMTQAWPMSDHDRKPKFRRGGGKGPDRIGESGRRPARHGRDAGPDGPVILYGWHTVAAALANPQRRIRKLLLTENAARRLADDNIKLPVTPEIVRPN